VDIGGPNDIGGPRAILVVQKGLHNSHILASGSTHKIILGTAARRALLSAEISKDRRDLCLNEIRECDGDMWQGVDVRATAGLRGEGV
jgi:hypothetical protein